MNKFNKGLKDKKNGSQNARALEFFEEQPVPKPGVKIFKCKICNEEKNGKTTRNLVTHLEHKHYDIYERSVKISTEKKSYCEKRLELIQNCVERVTVNKEPFNSLLKSGFQKIIADKLQKLEKAGFGITFDRNLYVIKEHLHATADKIRDKLKIEMKGRLISISADIVTKNHRSYLGIYGQYILYNEIVVRCIGMEELHESHTGFYLSEVIRKCLKEYDVDESQIISVTTDNGQNMIKMIEHLNESDDSEKETSEACSTSDTSPADVSKSHIPNGNENILKHGALFNNNEEDENEISELLHELDLVDKEEIDELLDGDESEGDDEWRLIHLEEEELLKNLNASVSFINTVNCAAHTLQLGIMDGLRSLDGKAKNVVRLARQVAKFLRKHSTIIEIKKYGLKQKTPRLDVITRWNSIYLMVGID